MTAGITLNLSLISFTDDMNASTSYITINSGDTVNDVIDAKVAADNSGDYGNAFENAEVFFDDVANAGDTNAVFFLGNGLQTGPWQAEKAALVAEHNVSVDTYLTDFVIDNTDAGFMNMSAMDDDGTTDLIYSDITDPNDPGYLGFGVAQDALSISDFV